VRSLFRSLIGLIAASLAACTSLPPRADLPFEPARPPGDSSFLDRAIGPAETLHPGQSAFRLVDDGREAFVTRIKSAQNAARSLDVQTYIWHADLTGQYLAQQLLVSADRGVHVRLLLDDLDARAKNEGIAALAAHPNIEVRLFNPFASREGTLRKAGEGLSNFKRLNHRMHNKTWIADNRIAIVGGRNVGDEYFGASDEKNFVDLDFSMIGPVVRDASASFDRYWNSKLTYPIETLDAEDVNSSALEKLRIRLASQLKDAVASRYAEALRSDDAVQRLVTGSWPMEWSATYAFVADDPLKLTMEKGDARKSAVVAAIAPLLKAAQTRADIISPYFVPGKQGTALLVSLAQEGRQVNVLTNSLAANDVAAVHGGYSQYRKPLLASGVRLWELKPLSGVPVNSSLFGSSGASLHTKAFSVDGRTLFVGSYNLDPRSTWLNCEQGVLVESEVLARQFAGIFQSQSSGANAWSVTLRHDHLSWSDGSASFDSDPQASAWRKFQAWLSRTLNLEAQL
jgi:cardiolipin synthase C